MRDSHILVIGESLVDIVQKGGEAKFHPGGSPMNVAVGLGRLGDNVRLLTRIGRDPLGARLISHLEAAGVEVCAGSFVDAATSTAVATVDDHGAASYEFDIEWALPPVAALAEPAIIHTGSIGSILEPGASTVRRMLAQCDDALVTFDPNIRPSLIDDHGRALASVEELVRLADVVKLSDEDARWLYPSLSPSEVLLRVAAMGPSLVIMTRGADGAVIRARGEQLELAALPVAVADTVGAGDAFMSGVIDSIIRNDLEVAIKSGTTTLEELHVIGAEALACAAVTVSRNGALPPTRLELDEIAEAYLRSRPPVR